MHITNSSTGLRNVCTFPAKIRSKVANITTRGELGVTLTNWSRDMRLISRIKEISAAHILVGFEAVASLYVLYRELGYLAVLLAILYVIMITVLSAWYISHKYESASPIDEPDKFAIESYFSSLKFGSAVNLLVFYPIRALIMFFVYTEVEHGPLAVMLYLLYTVHSQRSLIHVNSQEVNFHLDRIERNKQSQTRTAPPPLL